MDAATQRPVRPDQASDAASIRSTADELERAGRFLDAARCLDQLARDEREPDLEVRMVHLRHQAYRDTHVEPMLDQAWPPTAPDLFPGIRSAPEVPAAELRREHLVSAIQHHGCLIVRGLLDEEICAGLRTSIDLAFDGIDRSRQGVTVAETSPWFVPMDLDPGYELDPRAGVFLLQAGGVYGASAPRGFLEYLDAVRDAGIVDLVEQYLGETAVLSLNKCVLRRIGGGARPSWHQDGSYLGQGIRALDLWVSLSHCGGDTDTMGLEILPRPMDGLAEMGTYDAIDPRAVSQHVVEQLSAEADIPIQRPLFEPGDAMLFNEVFVHRSDVRPVPRIRYAVESWFFGPSTYPDNQIPIVAT
jgi:hypothetical protein